MLKSGANVLLLDEPTTNDLDTETLAAHMPAYGGDQHFEWFEGNLQDYGQDKIRRLGPDSVNSHRVTYEKLTRRLWFTDSPPVDGLTILPETDRIESASGPSVMNLPWDAHPDLAYDRLAAIAQMIVVGRDAAVVRHDPTIGDDDWVLGCRAFQACRSTILRSAGTEATAWLSIVDPSRHFIFKIGSVPVRFYRGDPEDAGHRTKAQSFPELAQLSLAFPGTDVRTLVYRIAVETDIDGRALAVHCVGWDGDNVVLNWPIPLKAVVTVAVLVKEAKPGVELSAPAVGEKDDGEATNDNDASSEARTDKTAS